MIKLCSRSTLIAEGDIIYCFDEVRCIVLRAECCSIHETFIKCTSLGIVLNGCWSKNEDFVRKQGLAYLNKTICHYQDKACKLGAGAGASSAGATGANDA